MKKMHITVLLIVTNFFVLSMLLSSCSLNKSEFNFEEKTIIHERDDGWYEFSSILYDNKDYYYYEYNSFNLKYDYIDGYDILIYDEKTGEQVEKARSVLPYLSLLPDVDSDITEIAKLFKKEKFMNQITIDDLESLELKVIDKKELMNRFNETVVQEELEDGKQTKVPSFYLLQSDEINGYKWQVAYFVAHGNIIAFRVELLLDEDKYLSDISIEDMDNKQKEIAKKIEEIEDAVLNSNDFAIDSSYDSLQIGDVRFDLLRKLIDEVGKLGE